MMRFCPKCNNMLHPRENKAKKVLEYACQPSCKHVEEEPTQSRVFLNEIIKDSSTRLEVIPSEVNKDPTLHRSRDVACPICLNKESVVFLAEQNAKSTRLTLVHVCCNTSCNHKWFDVNSKA